MLETKCDLWTPLKTRVFTRNAMSCKARAYIYFYRPNYTACKKTLRRTVGENTAPSEQSGRSERSAPLCIQNGHINLHVFHYFYSVAVTRLYWGGDTRSGALVKSQDSDRFIFDIRSLGFFCCTCTFPTVTGELSGFALKCFPATRKTLELSVYSVKHSNTKFLLKKGGFYRT